MNENLIRHGDVPMIRISKEEAERYLAESTTTPIKRIGGAFVLAYGETSGHQHVIEEKNVECFAALKGDIVIVPIGGAAIKHIDQSRALTLEHNTINLEEGYWLRVKQREYTLQGNRDVID